MFIGVYRRRGSCTHDIAVRERHSQCIRIRPAISCDADVGIRGSDPHITAGCKRLEEGLRRFAGRRRPPHLPGQGR
jgi:hypothetical protein